MKTSYKCKDYMFYAEEEFERLQDSNKIPVSHAKDLQNVKDLSKIDIEKFKRDDAYEYQKAMRAAGLDH